MTTVADRLRHLSGLSGVTMAQHLRAISKLSGVTVAAALIAYSGLPAGTANMATHLMVERVRQSLGGGSDALFDAINARAREERERISRQNDLILMTVIAAVTGGMLE